MEEGYKYFNRDISWLSFNYRVLMESEDTSLPVYERIKFLSIHASNLEEFYKVRVAEYRSSFSPDADADLIRINEEATRQQRESFRIFEEQLLPELLRNNIVLYQDCHIKPFHQSFVREYFNEEIFPFIQPVLILKNEIKMFLQDSRLYHFIRLVKNGTFYYAVIKIPFAKVPRFITLPPHEGKHYIMFIDDIVEANLPLVFPGFEINSCHSIKISRDADILIEEENSEEISKTIIQKVKKRKTGKLSRFVYDSRIPVDMLDYLCETFQLERHDLIPGGKYLNMEDLIKLPNPVGNSLEIIPPLPLNIPVLDKSKNIFSVIDNEDVLLNYPYQSFDYFLRFLKEAAFDPEVEEIKLTQYRVAENSAVIETLIAASGRKKQVTVFVELKARFDEENNWNTAVLMEQAGIHIVYSLPKLKVHAKLALVVKRKSSKNKDLAYLSTGNFNEKTAQLYADIGLFTSNKILTQEVFQVFRFLEEGKEYPQLNSVLVSQFNMVPSLLQMIEKEIEVARSGGKSRIILKMNGIQDEVMINALYKASEAGVQIDLIARGICCVIPNQPFSKNIKITRIVDMFLEHARIWYFYNEGKGDVYITSADWLRRNLSRRIEVAVPIYSPEIKKEIIGMLELQLADNVKACWVDEHLHNVRKTSDGSAPLVRAQYDFYRKKLDGISSFLF